MASSSSSIFTPPGATPPCIAAARRFDASRHQRFAIGDVVVGWIRLDDVELLHRWPQFFDFGARVVTLSARLDTPEARSEALAEVILQLANDGRITGWRDETFAIRNAFDDAPLAFIERAASRFFGTMTYAVHANGLIDTTPGAQSSADKPMRAKAVQHLWISRRSASKAVDPGMLDTLMGGGIGWGWSIADTLVKECWEESGIPAELAVQAIRGRTVHVLAEIEQGTQAEQLFIYDVLLPPSFLPSAQDGEVAEHLQVSVDALLQEVQAGRMTVDASLASLDCAVRHGWVDAATLPGFTQLYSSPLPIDAASGSSS